MTPWMFILNPFERWEPLLTDYTNVFDLWEAGGVRGIVVGRLAFAESDGTEIPTFAADAEIFSSRGVTAPAERRRDLDKEARFRGMLEDAARRGWEILIFDVRHDGGRLPVQDDPHGVAHTMAAAQDVLSAYPMAHGVILDGPGELPYELHPHRGREFLAVDAQRDRLQVLGYDLDRIDRAVAHLRAAFQRLTPQRVRYLAPGGFMGAVQLFDMNEDVIYWLQARQELSGSWVTAIAAGFDDMQGRLGRAAKLGAIPRTAAFSGLTGQDYTHLGQCLDYVFPKHYFWHRGFDGLYGSIWRWVRQLRTWNPTLNEADCFAVVKLWFGLDLPGVECLADMEMGFPDEFFTQTVRSETERALAAVGNPDQVIAWVSSGRLPHAGDMMTARDLHQILTVSAEAGLQRFVFHATHLLGAAEWTVMSRLCGTPWQDQGDFVWPADTDRNVICFSGRSAPKLIP